MKKVFIDGSAGTTGLRIHERLASRADISLMLLPEALRKDPDARRDALNTCDIAFLCLPDDAAREAVALTTDPHTVIIDTSTAHRTAQGWAYGFPEIGGRRDEIVNSCRIANPGCHASGFVALVAPLVSSGILAKDAMLSCFSLTGYTGGGKKMIAEYQDPQRNPLLDAPRMYGLTQAHKHLPEMAAICGMTYAPVFCPIVGDFPCGMEVSIPLTSAQCKGSLADIQEIYRNYYATGLVKYVDATELGEGGFMSAAAMAGRDDMQVTVVGNTDRMVLVARFDNLGKGASGAAIQNMNIVLGVDETTGLCV